MKQRDPLDCRRFFDVPADMAGDGGYFRSHSVGLQPRSVPSALADRVLAPWSQATDEPWAAWTGVVEGFGAALAGFLGGDRDDYCPQTNVSAGLAKFLFSLPCVSRPQKGRNVILLCRDDFPTVGHVLGRARRAGLELRFVEPSAALATVEGWLPHLTPDVALLHLTHVFPNSGLRTPVAAVTAAARALGMVSVVDTAQSAGVVPVTPAEWDADAVIGSCVKYLCGGPGAGWIWVRPDSAPALEPLDVGWFSHEDPFRFEIEHFAYAPRARRFFGGTPSVLPLAAATEGLRALTGIGALRIHGRVMALFHRLVDALPEGLAVSHTVPGQHGAALLIAPPGGEAGADALAAALARRRFAFDRRGGALRFSVHAYTSEEEVDRLAEALRAAEAAPAAARRRPQGGTHDRRIPMKKTKAVGINHISIEVGDIEQAIAFYTGFLEAELDDVGPDRASLEMGDQFLAMTLTADPQDLTERHFGLVVSDAGAARAALEEMGATILPGRFLRIRDPWNNLIEVVDYRNVRFSKTEEALDRLGLQGLGKNEKGRRALEGMRAGASKAPVGEGAS